MTAIKAVHRVWFDRGSLVLVVSPSARQSGEFVKKCAALLRVLDVPVRGDGTNRMSLMLPSGSRIVGLPANEGTTRGFTAPAMVMIDEASRVPDEIYLAMRPTPVSGNGDLWIMNTPKGKCGSFTRRGRMAASTGRGFGRRLRVVALRPGLVVQLPGGSMPRRTAVHARPCV